MTITALQKLEDGTIASTAPLNENFEALRVGVNTNESNLNNLTVNFDNLSKEVSDINEIVMPDLTYEKTDAKFLIAENRSQLRLKAGTVIRLDVSADDVRFLQVEEDQVYNVIEIMDTGISSLQAGKDYYIYLVAKDVVDSETNEVTKTVELKASINATYPTGYNSSNSRKIGGFHTLCIAVTSANAPALVDTNIWETHPAIGFNAGDVIPNSVWCLSHRPQSAPEGMVYVDKIDMWVDIYLQSGTGLATASVYGATVTASREPINHQWDLQLVDKKLATDNDFTIFAEGSNQKTAIYGAKEPSPKTAGGHTDTAGKRMISGYFVEECCGYLWQWLDELGPVGGSGFATYDGSASRGQTYGTPYVLGAGGRWNNSSSCGSRARSANDSRSDVAAPYGGRGVSLPLRV